MVVDPQFFSPPMTPDYITNALSKAESCKPHPVGDNQVRVSSMARITLPVLFYVFCCLTLFLCFFAMMSNKN